ncbi:Chaperone protein dnaJ 6 [Babesia sp. Xinjiang]|uniref:Chaperone protein dnaJ 6 n=1 Tax=Babesia sp. Xinjiang TaxID=462227 RepID=UPI000A21FEF4|nr:Chaperone protein dnaJ 6 [Babesia sp. Xinjiang]ORM40722.1 Chaperone protein dnaJ 6 [Babesia sp. Xinjiang]
MRLPAPTTRVSTKMSGGKLYEILGVKPDASVRDIVKAYRIAVLKTHPDKLTGVSESEREKATTSFLQLQHAYEILKDEEKREKYDKFGWEGEEDPAFAAAYEYYKNPVTTEDIDDFAKTYKGSAAEDEDLLDYYNKWVSTTTTSQILRRHNGNLTDILLYIPLSEADDLERFVEFYAKKIEDDVSCVSTRAILLQEIKSTSQFKKTSSAGSLKEISQKYKKKMKRESKRSTSGGNLEDLAAQIMANRKKREVDFNSVISNIERKYGKKVV